MHDKSAGGGETAAPHTQGKVIHWARFYDLVTALMSFGQSGRVRKATVDLAGIGAGERVLDVGCGTGTLTLMAGAKAGPSGEVHGIDASPEMIEVAREKAAKKRVEIGFQVALIEQLPFPDGHFDVVLSSLLLHHLPADLQRTGFPEIRRVLKPGGRLLALDLGARGRVRGRGSGPGGNGPPGLRPRDEGRGVGRGDLWAGQKGRHDGVGD